MQALKCLLEHLARLDDRAPVRAVIGSQVEDFAESDALRALVHKNFLSLGILGKLARVLVDGADAAEAAHAIVLAEEVDGWQVSFLFCTSA